VRSTVDLTQPSLGQVAVRHAYVDRTARSCLHMQDNPGNILLKCSASDGHGMWLGNNHRVGSFQLDGCLPDIDSINSYLNAVPLSHAGRQNRHLQTPRPRIVDHELTDFS
jgi:hypothetical protein